MASFAPVCPSRILSQLSPLACGDYHLLLAHDVAQDSDGYREAFSRIPMPTVIMDNSVIEMGSAVDLGIIKKAVSTVACTSIVLPDVLLDAKATVESCKQALQTWAEAFRDLGFSQGKFAEGPRALGRGFMIVPQGKTLQEWAWCAQQFADEPLINMWGIPRNLVGQIGSRRQAIEIADSLNCNRRIHLLGFSEDHCDDVVCAKMRRVEGIDSAVPLRIASYGQEITFFAPDRARGYWWDTADFVPLMNDNVITYRHWIGSR